MTTGASEAIVATVLAFVEPGDEVLVLEPWFDLYAAAIDLAGGVRVSVPPVPGTFRPDPDGAPGADHPPEPDADRQLAAQPHRAPSSPARSWPRSPQEAMAADLVVLSDEAYEHLWFDGHPHVPHRDPARAWPSGPSPSGSAGKSLSFTGWKVGWATGPADLIGAVRVIRQHLSYVSGGPFQWAVAEGLTALPAEHWDTVRGTLAHQRDLLTDGLTGLGLEVLPSEGTYFLLTDVTPVGYDSGEHVLRRAAAAGGRGGHPGGPLLRRRCPWDSPGSGGRSASAPRSWREAVDRLRAAFG